MASASFEFTLRVYFEDTDAGGVVFYANYLKFFERARTEWLRACRIEQQRLLDANGPMFAVRSTAVDYLKFARLDDALLIVSRIARLGGASADFYQEAWRLDSALPLGRELVATGRIKVACVQWQNVAPAGMNSPVRVLRPAPLPEQIRIALTAKT